MFGFNNLMQNFGGHVSVFYANGGSMWQMWSKPIGVKHIYMFCVGGGGGGQAGAGGVAGTTRAGGTGGAASGYSCGSFSANVLPDHLYVNVGAGGAGGTGGASSGANGSAGSLSYIAVSPDTITQNTVLRSGAVAAVATNGVTNTPAAGTVWSFTTGYVLPYLGLVTYNAGENGTPAGTSGGAGASVTVASIITGGAAGGGVQVSTPSAGGNITATGAFTGLIGGPSGGNAGSSGPKDIVFFESSGPFFFPGGAGGGSINSGTGGRGGNGSYGSGGGGGGAGTTGGNGGTGGDGLAIIISW